MGTWKRKFAHKLVDAGANIYVGHGDPRLQGIEIYRGCVILYCLGNLFFQTKTEVGFYGADVWESVIVQVHCHKASDADDGLNPQRRHRRQPKPDAGDLEAKAPDNDSASSPPNCCDPDDEAEDGDDGDAAMSSYSVKLIPILLNEVGDGFDTGHEHIVKGNVVHETQKQIDADVVALSRPSSPTLQLGSLPPSPLVLPSAPIPVPAPLPAPSSASYSTIPAFLTPPPTFSLNSPPRAVSQPSLLSSPSSPARLTLAGSPGTTPPSEYVPPLSPSPLTISSSYALHLATRGLPRVAEKAQGIAILQRIQKMSEEWGTIIEVDEGGEGGEDGVVGWVSTSREAELLHPFLRPRTKKEMKERGSSSTAAAAAVMGGSKDVDKSQRIDERPSATEPVLVSE